jgi:hypothetical protein
VVNDTCAAALLRQLRLMWRQNRQQQSTAGNSSSFIAGQGMLLLDKRPM